MDATHVALAGALLGFAVLFIDSLLGVVGLSLIEAAILGPLAVITFFAAMFVQEVRD